MAVGSPSKASATRSISTCTNGLDLRRDLLRPILSQTAGPEGCARAAGLLASTPAPCWSSMTARSAGLESYLDRRSENASEAPGHQPPRAAPFPVALAPASAAPARRQAPSLRPGGRPHDDFAQHVQGLRDGPQCMTGPSRGYVFGLENLISIMEQVWDENQ